jgi:hypothetical protein
MKTGPCSARARNPGSAATDASLLCQANRVLQDTPQSAANACAGRDTGGQVITHQLLLRPTGAVCFVVQTGAV